MNRFLLKRRRRKRENVFGYPERLLHRLYINDEKNGFVFESGNVDELVKKIEYAIQNREKLSAIGKNGRKIYDETFEMSIFEENLIALLSDILKE